MKVGEKFNPFRIFNGIYIPEALVKVPVSQLSQGAKIAYGRLCRYGGRDGKTYPNREDLACEIGCSVRQLDNYIKELKDFRLIDVKRTGLGKNNEYFYLWHELFDSNISSENIRDAVMQWQYSSTTNKKKVAITLYKESNSKESNKKRDTADTVNNQLIENIKDILITYRSEINPYAIANTATICAICDSLKEFNVDEMLSAIKGFSGDSWSMKHQSKNTIEWLLGDTSKVDKYRVKYLEGLATKKKKVITL